MHLFGFTCLFLISSAFSYKTQEFTKENLPGGAYVFFAGKSGGEISKQEMAGQIEVKVEGCAKGSRITVFTLVVTQGRKTSTFTGKSGVLTADMRAKLNSLGKEDFFEFRDMKAYWTEEKREISVAGAKFVVV